MKHPVYGELPHYLEKIEVAVKEGRNPPHNVFVVLCDFARMFNDEIRNAKEGIKAETTPTIPRHEISTIKDTISRAISTLSKDAKSVTQDDIVNARVRLHEAAGACDQLLRR